jgi:hypothetical protein
MCWLHIGILSVSQRGNADRRDAVRTARVADRATLSSTSVEDRAGSVAAVLFSGHQWDVSFGGCPTGAEKQGAYAQRACDRCFCHDEPQIQDHSQPRLRSQSV